jgi:hypothetical protein
MLCINARLCDTNTIVTPCPQLVHVVEAAPLELFVAHCDHFVDHQDLGIHVHDRNRAAHTCRSVHLHRAVDELRQPRVDDVVEDEVDVTFLETEDRAVEIDVLRPDGSG